MVIVIDKTFGPPTNGSSAATVAEVRTRPNWVDDERFSRPRGFDPRAAGRRAVRRHAGALRKLADWAGPLLYLDLPTAVEVVEGARDEAYASGDDRLAPPQPLEDCRTEIVDAAINAPAATFGGREAYPDLPTKAAVLAYRLVKGHACPDGNKRLALILSSAFLQMNGFELDAEDDETDHVFRTVAGSDAARHAEVVDDLRQWFSECIVDLGED